ncbi:nucleotidyltransferase family protein [Ascidiimonas aurantiaca]|uniref:nucleotidyltransferase family protein n=1 Tax=Ascidiimonas aurantiaca TaxID=1685432 RepID=UPI0030ECED87
MVKAENSVMVILAAGKSSRMGRPKQLLPWGNRTLLGHVIQQSITTGFQKTIVVLGAYEKHIRSTLANYPVQYLFNKKWEEGMGSSIALGASYLLSKDHLNYQGVLISLGDQPFVDISYYKKMLATYTKGKCQIIATSYGHKSGVPALFDPYYLKGLSNLKGPEGAAQLISQNKENVLSLPADFKTTDIDTEEQYMKLHKIFLQQAGN